MQDGTELLEIILRQAERNSLRCPVDKAVRVTLALPLYDFDLEVPDSVAFDFFYVDGPLRQAGST